MSNFEEEIKRRTEEARNLEKRQRDEAAQAEQVAEDRQNQRRDRTEDLKGLVPQRMQQAAAASGGSLSYEGATESSATRRNHVLTWVEPPPQRSLHVRVDSESCTIDWGWRVAGGGDNVSVDALNFDDSLFNELIFRLADQAVWASGRRPKRP